MAFRVCFGYPETRRICPIVNKVVNLRGAGNAACRFCKHRGSRANPPIATTCEGLRGTLAEGAASADTEEALGCAGPVWAKISGRVL